AALDVGGHRHTNGAHDARGRLDHLPPGRMLAVGKAERPVDAAAGGGNRAEARGLEQPRAHGVPRIRQEQKWGAAMRPPEGVRLALLLVLGHDSKPTPAARPLTRQRRRAPRLPLFDLSMIFSENRFPSRITSG